MKHLEDLQHQEEYQTRILVFKVDDNTIYDCHHLVKYDLRMFKGTREEFNNAYFDAVGDMPQKDYMVYDKPEQIAKVKHGFRDDNVIYVNNNKDQKQRQADYKYLKSSY